jgi:hypothetical protein
MFFLYSLGIHIKSWGGILDRREQRCLVFSGYGSGEVGSGKIRIPMVPDTIRNFRRCRVRIRLNIHSEPESGSFAIFYFAALDPESD